MELVDSHSFFDFTAWVFLGALLLSIPNPYILDEENSRLYYDYCFYIYFLGQIPTIENTSDTSAIYWYISRNIKVIPNFSKDKVNANTHISLENYLAIYYIYKCLPTKIKYDTAESGK